MIRKFLSKVPIKFIVKLALLLAVITTFVVLCKTINSLKDEKQAYQSNVRTLLEDVERYTVQDSLNAVKVFDLELQIDEFKRYRSRDMELIKELQVKNKKLSEVSKARLETIQNLQGIVKDTVVYVTIIDSVPIKSKSISIRDKWVELDGVITNDIFTGTVKTIDSLLITESVTYKRFLGFLWKTRKVKEREFDVVSRNPNTTIADFEVITIRK